MRQFVVDDLHHHLLGLHGSEHVLAEGFLLHRFGELFGNLIVDVGIEQRAAHVFQCLGDVYLSDFAFALQYLE